MYKPILRTGLVFALLAGALPVRAETKDRGWIVLSEQRFGVGKEAYALVLRIEDLVTLPRRDLQEKNSPYVLLELVKRTEFGDRSAQILWVDPEVYPWFDMPRTRLCGSLVLDEKQGVVHVLVCRNPAMHAILKVFEIDPRASPKLVLPDYDSKGELKNLRSLLDATPQAATTYDHFLRTGCSVEAAQMKFADGILHVALERSQCEATKLSYNLSTKVWSEENTTK